MAIEDDITLLESLREKIEAYLVFGGALPAQPLYADQQTDAWAKMQSEPPIKSLRREINLMKGAASAVLSRCRVSTVLVQYPPPAVGGPIIRQDLLDAITDNPFWETLPVSKFTDLIDEAIGILRSTPSVGGPTAAELVAEITKGFVFIVMPMAEDDHALADVHDTIKAAAAELGLTAERVDDQNTNDRITDRILDALARAEYVVADLSSGRPNVYYEAGYAHALGKIPIYVAREGTKIEFDLKDYPILFYKNMRGLRDALKSRLAALQRATKR